MMNNARLRANGNCYFVIKEGLQQVLLSEQDLQLAIGNGCYESSHNYCEPIARKLTDSQLAERDLQPVKEKGKKGQIIPVELLSFLRVDSEGVIHRRYGNNKERPCVVTDPRGFRFVSYKNKRYNAASVAFAYHTGLRASCLVEQIDRDGGYHLHNLQPIIGIPSGAKNTMVLLRSDKGELTVPMRWGTHEPDRYEQWEISKEHCDDLEHQADEFLRANGGFAPHGCLSPSLR